MLNTLYFKGTVEEDHTQADIAQEQNGGFFDMLRALYRWSEETLEGFSA